MNQLTVGNIVQCYVDPRSNNGSEITAAVLTRVWGQMQPYAAVNWRLILDHQSNDPATNEWRTSVYVFPTKAEADAYLDYTAEQQYGVTDESGEVDQVKKVEFIRGRKAAGSVGWVLDGA